MNCLYCRAWNSDDDHRCQRCGRRLNYSAPPIGRPITSQYSHTALAEDRAPRPRAQAKPVPQAPELVRGSGTGRRQGPSYQPTLFGTRDMGQVLPFGAFVAGGNVTEKPLRPRATRPKVRRQSSTNQQSLNFTAPPATPAVSRPVREGVIYCDASVASLEHRSLAAFVDFTMVAIALGLFVGTLYVFGGEVVLSSQSAPVYAGAAAVMVFLYRLLWALGNGDSPGMRAMQLRLVDLDGRRPNRRQRFLRLVSGWLSVLAAGLGLFWALADEESLTWHDHISRTFPASRD
jgi:uncharacterized RDD family membrane protein YckC